MHFAHIWQKRSKIDRKLGKGNTKQRAVTRIKELEEESDPSWCCSDVAVHISDATKLNAPTNAKTIITLKTNYSNFVGKYLCRCFCRIIYIRSLLSAACRGMFSWHSRQSCFCLFQTNIWVRGGQGRAPELSANSPHSLDSRLSHPAPQPLPCTPLLGSRAWLRENGVGLLHGFVLSPHLER